MILLLYLALGAVAGLLAGLFGIGGGLIIVPVLVISFAYQGISPDVLTHMAIGTSLATIVFTSMSSVKTHQEKGGVRWEIFKPMAVGIVLGAIIGVYTAAELSGPVLQKIIGVFALLMAVQMGFGLKPKPNRDIPGNKGLVGVGTGIGWASAIFGIGGGSLSVPFLSWCNVRMQQAVGTSAACGLPIAVTAALTNIYKGWGESALPEWSAGFIYLPAFIGIIMTSVYFARIGAKLAHKLSPIMLKRIFAVLLVVVGLKFLLA